MDQSVIDRRLRLVRMTILRYVDAIYLTTYSSRRPFTNKSVEHIVSATHDGIRKASAFIKSTELNDVENRVFGKLRGLLSAVQNNSNDKVERIIHDTDDINLLLSREDNINSGSSTLKYIRLVLAMCGQFDYNDISIVLPNFSIHRNNDGETYRYSRSIYSTGYGIEANLNTTTTYSTTMWYNLFKMIIVPGTGERNSDVTRICSILHIPVAPDVRSGIGIDKVTYDSYLASDIVKRYMMMMNGTVLDTAPIKNALQVNNRGILDSSVMGKELYKRPSDIMYTGSYEANADDIVIDNKPDENNPPAEGDDPPEDELSIDDPTKAEGDDPPEDEVQIDSNVDETGDNPDDPDNPPEESPDGGDNNTDEPNEGLLGLNFELPKNETLDDLLYKITVAKQIDTIVKLNQKEVPIETVTALTNWKALYLFLVSVKETERFLDKFKIK